MIMAREAQNFQAALVERLENRSFLGGVVIVGALLILATLAAPSLATWVENCFLNGG